MPPSGYLRIIPKEPVPEMPELAKVVEDVFMETPNSIAGRKALIPKNYSNGRPLFGQPNVIDFHSDGVKLSSGKTVSVAKFLRADLYQDVRKISPIQRLGYISKNSGMRIGIFTKAYTFIEQCKWVANKQESLFVFSLIHSAVNYVKGKESDSNPGIILLGGVFSLISKSPSL